VELTKKDKTENVIYAVIVIPRSNRLYDYYINGQEDRRVMLQRSILQFCSDLCPSHAAEIRQCVFEIKPFAIFPQTQEFKELINKEPPKINRRSVLYPMRDLLRKNKINLLDSKETALQQWANNFSIWKEYNVYLDSEKKNKTKKFLKSHFN